MISTFFIAYPLVDELEHEFHQAKLSSAHREESLGAIERQEVAQEQALENFALPALYSALALLLALEALDPR
jgi:hypothetical protein